MLSRVADSMYWMNRYLERVQNYARFIEVNLNMHLELTPEFEEQWLPLVQTTGDDNDFLALYPDYSRDNVVQFLTFEKLNPSSIMSSLAAARENARSIRECISGEMWEAINTLYLSVKDSQKKSQWTIEELFEFFESIKHSSYLVSGIAHNTISHTERWHFARLGQFLERADKLSRIIDVHSYYLAPKERSQFSTFELIQWVAILRSTSAYEMYLREFGEPKWNRIVEFLLLNPYFPRSLRYCMQQIQKSAHAITGNDIGTFRLPIEKSVGRMKVNLDYIEIDEIIGFGLHDYLDRVQVRLNEVGILVYESFVDPNANMEPISTGVDAFNT